MTQTYYDPDVDPDPRAWLALPSRDRVRVVQNYHIAKKLKSKRALRRLMSEGESRHDALHAIGEDDA